VPVTEFVCLGIFIVSRNFYDKFSKLGIVWEGRSFISIVGQFLEKRSKQGSYNLQQ